MPARWDLGERTRRHVAAATVATLLLNAGCSWIAVSRPPRTGEPPIPCTDSRAAPVADTVMAVVGGLFLAGALTVFIADASEKGEGRGFASALIGVPLLGGGVLLTPTYGLSAHYGFSATAQCRRLPAETERRLAGSSASVGASAPPRRSLPVREPGPPWPAAGRGDVALSPVRAGVVVDNFGGGASGGFGLFSDFDYHVTANFAVGALVSIIVGPNINSGSGSGFGGLGIGPQLKLLYDSPDHAPFLRLALPVRVFPGAYGRGASYGVALLQVGAGYRYWFHRRIGLGFDASFVPTLRFGAFGSFILGLQFSSGVDVRF